jgi:hypothetical protein
MRGVSVNFGSPITEVSLSGTGANPLESPLAQIKWSLTVSLDVTDPNHPKAWVSHRVTTCYPAHVLKVNGMIVYSPPQPPRNDISYISYIGACLLSEGSAITPSTPTAVPAH